MTGKIGNELLEEKDIPSVLLLESDQKPEWLHSSYSSLTWTVTDIGNKPNRQINFDVCLPDGSKLSQHSHFLETIKRVVYGIRTGPLLVVESGSKQQDVAHNLINLVRWMVIEKISHFSDLQREDLEVFCRDVAYGWNSALKVEPRLIALLQRKFNEIDLNDWDAKEVRVKKAAKVFSIRQHNPYQTTIDRFALMDEIGVGNGVFISKGSERIVRLLDQADLACGMYVGPKQEWRMAKSLPESDDQTVSWIHLARCLEVFNYLYVHRRYLDDTLLFKPFVGTSVSKKAQAIGARVGRTRSIPIKQGITMIERSVRWVIDYAPQLLEISEKVNQIFRTSSSSTRASLCQELLFASRSGQDLRCSPWPLNGIVRTQTEYEFLSFEKRNGISLRQAMLFLQTACAVVIAAFSARRAAEITSLKAGCIKQHNSNIWLTIFIHKTLQAEDTVPVPEIVKEAVSVLEKISAKARSDRGDDRLFQFSSEYASWSADTISGKLSSNIEDFGFYLDIPKWKGELWQFKAHQFRRFFAILYVYIYDLGDFGVLSYYLRHFNPEMTRHYIRDDELGQILSDVKREQAVSIIYNAALGNSRVSGKMGNRLVAAAQRLREQMAKRLTVVSEDRLVQKIERMLQMQQLELHATPWGYCAVKRAKEAPCIITDDSVGEMDFSRAHAGICRACDYSMRTPEFVPLWEKTRSQHLSIASSNTVPRILRTASERCVSDLNALIEESKGEL